MQLNTGGGDVLSVYVFVRSTDTDFWIVSFDGRNVQSNQSPSLFTAISV